MTDLAYRTYYNFARILSFNCIYNFLCGARGLGKTYGAKKRAIKNALTKGEEFIYLRRYAKELTAAKNTFFADIADEFPDWELKVIGKTAIAAKRIERLMNETDAEFAKRDKSRVWKTMGYFVALVSAQGLKSVSYPRVQTILFDEFIIEKGAFQYLPNETTVFNNFYSTVARSREGVRVFFLANTVSMMNPYFITYRIRPDEEEEFVFKFPKETGGHFICAHFPDSAQFKSQAFASTFGQFLLQADPEYADYAIGNQFADNHSGLLRSKPETARYLFTLETGFGTFSVWEDRDSTGKNFYVQTKRPRGNETLFTMVPERMQEGKTLLNYGDKIPQIMRGAFKNGYVYFDEPMSRNTFGELFAR